VASVIQNGKKYVVGCRIGTQPLPEDQELEQDSLTTALHKDLPKFSRQF